MAAAPVASLIIGLVGAGVTAYGQIKQSDFQQAAAKRNADLQKLEAADAEARGNIEAQRVALAGGYVKGAKRAAFGASGVSANSGSPLETLADQALFTKLDVETTRANASREAFGYQAGATNSLIGGKLARSAGRFGAGSSLLTGASNAAGDYYGLTRGYKS